MSKMASSEWNLSTVHMYWVQDMYRAISHASTGQTPAKLFFGRKIRTKKTDRQRKPKMTIVGMQRRQTSK